MCIFQSQRYTQRTRAIPHFDWIRQPDAPRCDICVIELRGHRALPFGQIIRIHTVTGKVALDFERRSKNSRRSGLQAKEMVIPFVVQAQRDACQFQLRRRKFLVLPKNRGIANDQVPLFQQPITKIRPPRILAERNPSHIYHPLGITQDA